MGGDHSVAMGTLGGLADLWADFMKALGAVLGRPAVLPAPALALKLILGEFASDILASQRVLPSVLTASGFVFDHDTIESAMHWLVDQT